MPACYKCGAKLSGSGKFCPECGAPQQGAAPHYGERLTGINLSGDSPRFSLSISPGETLFNSRFVIESHIGFGGFGEVYLAMDQYVRHRVALKIVPTGEGEEETAAEQLLNEKNLRRNIVNFEHIIQVNDPYVDSDYKGLTLVLLSMEYADGGSLRRWITENNNFTKLEEKRSEALRYFREACLGVKMIHDAGLVHLDLKPENLLLMNDKVKVSDLGLSRNYIQYAQNRDMILKEHATPSYMSPEQFKSARQKDINHLSDIYSLGIILFELLDGHVPFDGNYAELKEKHLTYKPPSLGDALAPWGRIVNRCMAKEPSKRFESVDDLLSDLKRAEKGDVLSVDVSCKCGHINDNKDLRKCPECGADISHLFRRCPSCQRLNRLDVEVCPDCGLKVGRHFRIEALLKKAHEMRDVDPAEAIRCLVEVLKLEGGNREAREMLPGLREIHEKIEKITPDAGKAEEEGRLEDAKGKWQDILSLAPRHLLATKRKKRLDKLIGRYNTNYDRSFVLMDQGKFLQARELLSECRDLIPARKETDTALKDLNKREKAYSEHFEKAKSEARVKNLRSASREVDLCLLEAPKSEEGLRLKAKIYKDMDKVERLFSEAKNLLKAAEFDSVQRDIEQIQALQKDLSGFKGFIPEKEEKEKRFHHLSSKWKTALKPEIKDLSRAEENLKEAIKICPECRESIKLLDQVVGDKDRAIQLIKDAKFSIRAADFAKAKDEITKAKGIWPKVPELINIVEKLVATKQIYNNHINEGTELYKKKKDLDSALEQIRAALKICPKSLEAKNLADEITKDQEQANHLVEEAIQLLRAADFEKAQSRIDQAGLIWPKVSQLTETRHKLETTRQNYNTHINKAMDLYEKNKELNTALDRVRAALKICPKSLEAKNLADEITKDQEQANHLVEEAIQLLRAADFEKAQSRIDQAGLIWPKVPELIRTKNNLDITRKSYNNHISAARALCSARYGRKGLDLASLKGKSEDALAGCNKAIELCPGSREAKDLEKEIVSLLRKTSSLIKMTAERKKKRNKIIFITLTIFLACTLFLFSAIKIIRHFDPNVLKVHYFAIVLLFSLFAYTLFSAFAPVLNREKGGYMVLGLWAIFGVVNIISCVVFRYVFHKTWITGASVGLTISAIYIIIVIIGLLAMEKT